ncbi:SusC/RagA family TonB-linked outer membrane protein [Kaistella sp. G5-32]|uniref:SusC/RagA family TonB-linked outer membrane protein n=1 Tax=Kaistella gelatinilytica TaxID=2787636 RepID=A0ABS0FCH9_9FLAO|nr:SusC/RagA family TonB-linked outer membrane protein [Kaistella gelatinilytica]MBF8457429.1 SusC/RagA family TonB-linked outer membrane protein [Kaistella gelatinilytica]
MKKLTTTVLAVVLTSSFALVNAQKRDTARTQDIEGVVVTALGIKREKKALGYATQSVSAEDITKSPSANFTSNLSGKVSGLSIKSSGNVGGSVDVTLRGYRSITGSNQPLFVVDGTPMLNSSTSVSSTALNVDTGNTISDINPDDIAEINVLKGAAATALYGSRASNGAIIITTKRGKATGRIGIDFSSSISVSNINKETFPTYQKTYGQGYGYKYGPTKKSQFELYNGAPLAPMYEDASYGAAFDPNLLVWQYTSFIPGSKNFGNPSPWIAGKNDPSSLFETGVMYNNSFAISNSNDVSSFRLSYQNTYGNDILPNTNLNKNSLTGNASYKITSNLTANLYATYVTQNTTGKNPTGYHGITGNFRQWWATNVDLQDQQDLYFMSKKNFSWNIKSPTQIAPLYWDNPYFRLYENYITDSRQRFAGNFSLSYDVTNKINILARATHDGFSYFIDERRAVGSLPDTMSIGPAIGSQPSGYAVVNQKRNEDNYDLIGTYKDNFFNNNVNFYGILGSNVNVQNFYSNSQSTQGGLFIPGVYSVTNTLATAPSPTVRDTTKKVYGIFAQANFGILNTYYIDGTVRRDESSSLPAENRAYWYYSASLSAVISNWQFLKDINSLSFAKLRGSYAEVGNDTAPDQILNQYGVTTAFGTSSFFYNTTAKFAGLRPERTKSYEAGATLQFFKNRIGIDFAWYKNDTFDQLLALPVSYTTGVAAKFQNVGNISSRGLELTVNLVPIKTTDFTWGMDVNWSNPRSKVTKLSEGVENISIGSFQGGVTINASLNDDYGTIKGTDFVYDPSGNPIVDGNPASSSYGKYLKTNTNAVIGNMQADWFGSVVNKFSYKNVSLSFQIDWKQGGDIFSLDQYYGQDTGLYPETVFTNDLGNPVRNTLANGGGLILPGVKTNGSGGYSPNDVRLDAASTGAFGYEAYPAKQFVYDATYIKLREVAITYAIPQKFLDATFVKGASVSLVGNNLWIIKKYLPYADPESGLSAGNVQGYQSAVLPTTRTISFNVKLNF